MVYCAFCKGCHGGGDFPSVPARSESATVAQRISGVYATSLMTFLCQAINKDCLSNYRRRSLSPSECAHDLLEINLADEFNERTAIPHAIEQRSESL
jgi:hypothetical protein